MCAGRYVICTYNAYVYILLQPENILLASADQDAPIKIADFGLANLVDPDSVRAQFTLLVGASTLLGPVLCVPCW